MEVLFVIAVLVKSSVVVVVTHWLMIGAAFLMGSSLDRVVVITEFVVFLLVSALAMGFTVGRKQLGAIERMVCGPIMVGQGRLFVVVMGFSSGLGGLFLFAGGSTDAGGWATALGTVMVLLEVTAVYCVSLVAKSSD